MNRSIQKNCEKSELPLILSRPFRQAKVTNSKPWSDFPPILPNQWNESARQELNGEDPSVKLQITKGKINILPYYEEDVANPSSVFSLPNAKNSFLGARAWTNAPKILVTDDTTANARALKHLNAGADGVFFEITSSCNISALLKGIQLPFCHVFFSGKIDASFCRDFEKHVNTNFPDGNVQGALFPLGGDIAAFATLNSSFKVFGLTLDEKETTEETIAYGLKNLVTLLDKIADEKNLSSVLNQVAYSTLIGTDFFQEIAKLKTLRTLFALVSKAYGAENVTLHIHATSDCWIKDAFQPHGNLVKSTTAGIAAVLGGCDSLTIEPEGETEMTGRFARNISLLLRDESQMARVADPLEGAYYLESLCQQLAEKAWTRFQELIKS